MFKTWITHQVLRATRLPSQWPLFETVFQHLWNHWMVFDEGPQGLTSARVTPLDTSGQFPVMFVATKNRCIWQEVGHFVPSLEIQVAKCSLPTFILSTVLHAFCLLTTRLLSFYFLPSLRRYSKLNQLHLCPFLISSTKICWRGNLFTPLLCVSPFKSHVLCILSPLSLQPWHLIIPFCPRATNLLSDASC